MKFINKLNTITELFYCHKVADPTSNTTIQSETAERAAKTKTCVLVKFIKHNQNNYLKLDVSTSVRGLRHKKLVLSSSDF